MKILKIKYLLILAYVLPLSAMKKEHNLVELNKTGAEAKNSGYWKESLKKPKSKEEEQFINLLGEFAPKVVEYIANELNNKPYFELSESDKINILKYFINSLDSASRSERQVFYRNFKNLTLILKLKNFEKIANNESAHIELLTELKKLTGLYRANVYELSIYLATPAAVKHLRKLLSDNPAPVYLQSDMCLYVARDDIERVKIFLAVGIRDGEALGCVKSMQMFNLLLENGVQITHWTRLKWLQYRMDDLIKLKSLPSNQLNYQKDVETKEQYLQKIDNQIEELRQIIKYLKDRGVPENWRF